jgi:hypothetical protein
MAIRGNNVRPRVPDCFQPMLVGYNGIFTKVSARSEIIDNTIYHGIDLDLFIALFTLTSLATCSSIPRILAKSDVDAISSDLYLA